MKLAHLILREIASRKISFFASLLAVCASTCCVVASFGLLKTTNMTPRSSSGKKPGTKKSG